MAIIKSELSILAGLACVNSFEAACGKYSEEHYDVYRKGFEQGITYTKTEAVAIVERMRNAILLALAEDSRRSGLD